MRTPAETPKRSAPASIIFILLFGSMASFALSRFKFKFNFVILVVLYITLTIPIHITLIPIYMIANLFMIHDTLFGLICTFIGINLPLTVIILYTFMNRIPEDFEDVAVMEGASYWAIYTRIILPMSKPALTTMGIFNMSLIWNDFIYPLVLINSDQNNPLTLALYNYYINYQVDIPILMASIILVAIPILCVYILLNKKIIESQDIYKEI